MGGKNAYTEGLLYSDFFNWTRKLEKNTVSANDMIVFLEKKS